MNPKPFNPRGLAKLGESRGGWEELEKEMGSQGAKGNQRKEPRGEMLGKRPLFIGRKLS